MHASEHPLVSIVIPCRNERDYIIPALDSIRSAEYPKDRLEILVIDGMSDDGTAERLRAYVNEHRDVRLLKNSARTVPVALNLGVREARGDVIMRMDAHVEYPPQYVPRLVKWLLESEATNVGGLCITRPGANTPMARAIAFALSHPLGVGNSRFRIGTDRAVEVDTVPFGCYRREVFDQFGLFDEELTRNQDDEFNHRISRGGGRILLVPDVVSHYFARRSLGQVARMFYQYGLFKPLAARKVGKITTLRQLVPPFALISLVGLAIAAWWGVLARMALAAFVLSYAGSVTAISMRGVRTLGFATVLRLFAVFPSIHGSYGLGYLLGAVLVMFPRRRRKIAKEIPLSR